MLKKSMTSNDVDSIQTNNRESRDEEILTKAQTYFGQTISEDQHNATVYVGSIRRMMTMAQNISGRKGTVRLLFNEDTEILTR